MKGAAPRFLGTLLVSSLLLAALLSSSAMGDRSVQAIVRDGNYGKLDGVRSISFKVRNRQVSRIYFTMPISCVNNDTGEEYLRYFDGTNLAGGTVARGGRYQRNFSVSSNGRDGTATITLEFNRNRPLAVISVLIPSAGLETCDGEISLRFQRLN